MKKLLTGFIAASFFFPVVGGAGLAATSYDDGVRDYNAGNYPQSVKSLSEAARLDPLNPLVHYYLANALVRVKEHRRAAREYRLSFLLDPTSIVAGYCKQALTKYKQPIPAVSDTVAFRDTVAGAQRSGAPMLSRSLSTIRRQVEYEKTKNKNISDTTSSDIVGRAQKAAREVDLNAQMEIERLYMPQPRQAPISAELLAQKEQAIRNAAKDEQDRILRDAATKADRYQRVGALKQTVLDQVAANLETQMYESGSNSGVRLIPQGTDLYVRQYATVKTSKVIPDAHPAVVRIYGRPFAGEEPTGIGTSIGAPAGHTDKAVRGEILK